MLGTSRTGTGNNLYARVERRNPNPLYSHTAPPDHLSKVEAYY